MGIFHGFFSSVWLVPVSVVLVVLRAGFGLSVWDWWLGLHVLHRKGWKGGLGTPQSCSHQLPWPGKADSSVPGGRRGCRRSLCAS